MVTKDQIQSVLNKNEVVMLYFYNDNCAPCMAIRPKLQEMLRKFPEIKTLMIDASANMVTASEFEVFTSPLLILFFDGKEYLRKGKFFSMQELHDEIDRLYTLYFNIK
jgi:thioredoxin 1